MQKIAKPLVRTGAARTVLAGRRAHRLFIKWFPHDTRNDVIAAAIGASSHYIHFGRNYSVITAPVRYVVQMLSTWLLLWRHRPAVVFVTSPPIFAPLTVWLYTAATGASFIMDCHSGVFDRKWRFVAGLHRFVAKRACMVMVTNSVHAAVYRQWGARPFILGDLMPPVPTLADHGRAGCFTVVVACSFALDEPIGEILAAAAITPSVQFLITGNHLKDTRLRGVKVAANVQFTGFLEKSEYLAVLQRADAVMALTTRDHTMQNAAYEALALRKPMVLSDWQVLRATYKGAAAYAKNTPEGIAQAVSQVVSQRAVYAAAVSQVYEERQKLWMAKSAALRQFLDQFDEPASPQGAVLRATQILCEQTFDR
jgi:glycosyltransferase involved in cell wall biosynthesis